MKENSVGTSESMANQELNLTPVGCVPRLQKQYVQLACKENISEYNEGLGHSMHINLAPRRPIKQQQHSATSGYHQMSCLEVNKDCICETAIDTLTPNNAPPTSALEHRAHVSYPSHFLPSAHTRQQPHQQTCKFKISQLMSCEQLECISVSPLPHLQWARSADLWRTMRSKDVSKAAPEAELRLHHPEILSSMRIILLDWMMEVGVINGF